MQFQYRVRKKGSNAQNIEQTPNPPNPPIPQNPPNPPIPQKPPKTKQTMKLNLDSSFSSPTKNQPPVPKKRILVVKKAEAITTKHTVSEEPKKQIALDVHVMEEMKSKMANQINQQLSQQKAAYEKQIQIIKNEDNTKLKELQEFTKTQEQIRKNDLREFTQKQQELINGQKSQWETEYKKLEDKYKKTMEEKEKERQKEIEHARQREIELEKHREQYKDLDREREREQERLRIQETEKNSLLEIQKKWFEDQQLLFQKQKEEWFKEQEKRQEDMKIQWIKTQDDKQEQMKQQWLKEYQRRMEEETKKNINFVKENDLEPALERFITQVISCTVDNESPETKFEQMIGPTIEKLVRKILDADNEEKVDSDENTQDDERSVHYDDIYDFEIDDNSIQNIRNALIRNNVVNPLFNKKEREHKALERNTQDLPSLEMNNIYNNETEQYFDNELRSNVNTHKRWFTYGSGVQKDVITSIFVDTKTKNLIICGLFRTVNMCQVRNIAMFNYERKEWNSIGGGLDNMATCITKHKDYLFVGGVFSTVGNDIPAKHIAKYHFPTKKWSSLGEGLNSECCALCYDEKTDKLYAGGTFTYSGKDSLQYIGIYDIQSDTWQKLVGGELNAPCRTLFLDGNMRQLYAGGLFTSAGVENTSYIAQYDMENEVWKSLSQGLQGYCNSIYVHKHLLYAGGTFHCVGNNIAQYDIKTNTWKGLQEGLNGICNAVCVNNRGQIFVGGSFTNDNENDTVLNRVAMFDINENKWYPLENFYNTKNTEDYETGLDSICKSMFITDENLFVVGSFQKAGNIDAGCIAKYKM